MAITALTSATFQDAVTKPGVLLVDFWASWCPPCSMFSPVFEAASDKHEDIFFGTVDTDAEEELFAQMQLAGIPALMVFRDGILVFDQAGALPAHVLEQVIEAVRTLDMDEVRALLAEQDAAEEEPAEEESAEAESAQA